MARGQVHTAVVRTKSLSLPKAGSGIEVDGYNDLGKVGTLHIGQGGVYWTTKHKQSGKRLSWTEFDNLMCSHFGVE